MWTGLFLFLGMAVVLHETPDLDRLQWRSRVVLLFSDEGDTAVLKQQEQALENASAELAERDMRVFSIIGADPKAQELRRRVRISANGFAVVLIGKDGSSKFHRTKPVAPEELFHLVDSMPMRRAEKRQE